MLEKLKQIPQEWVNFFLKIIIPALVGVGIKIAIQMNKKEKVSLLSVCLSIIIGCGFSFLFGFFILHNFNEKYVPALAGLIGIMGEKIGTWLIYKFKIDQFLQNIADLAIQIITKKNK